MPGSILLGVSIDLLAGWIGQRHRLRGVGHGAPLDGDVAVGDGRRTAVPLPAPVPSSASARDGAAVRPAVRRLRSRAPTARPDRTAVRRRGPCFTRSSTRSGWSFGPLITVSPEILLAPMMRNQRPQVGGDVAVLPPGRSRVTGWAMPCGRHHRLEALRDDLARRLRRQHGGERRAVDAHRPARIPARTTPAARRHCRHRPRCSRSRASGRMPRSL